MVTFTTHIFFSAQVPYDTGHFANQHIFILLSSYDTTFYIFRPFFMLKYQILAGYLTRNSVFCNTNRLGFLGAEACLVAGSARNAYHTKYRGYFGASDLSCATLRKGVFSAGAALVLVSLVASLVYYWAHSKADTGGWQKHRNEGVGMTATFQEEERKDFEKA